jgi:hypothetical protein
MKNLIFGTVVCLGALVGMGTASAQMVEQLKVNLPYAATVGGVTLPAGEYTIRNLNEDGGSAVLQFSSFNGKTVAAMASEVVAPKHQNLDEAKVVLKQTGEGYQIQSVWLQGQEVGYEFTR